MTARARGPGTGPFRLGRSMRTCSRVVAMGRLLCSVVEVENPARRDPEGTARAATSGGWLVGPEKPRTGRRWRSRHDPIVAACGRKSRNVMGFRGVFHQLGVGAGVPNRGPLH